MASSKPKSEYPTVHQTGLKTLPSQAPTDYDFKLVDPKTINERCSARVLFVSSSGTLSEQQFELDLCFSQWLHIKKTKRDKLTRDLLSEDITLDTDGDDKDGLIVFKIKVVLDPGKDKKDKKVKCIQSVFQKLMAEIKVLVSFIKQDLVKDVKKKICESRVILEGSGTVHEIPEKSCIVVVTDKDVAPALIEELNDILKSCCETAGDQNEKQSCNMTDAKNALVKDALTLGEKVQSMMKSKEVTLKSSVNEFLQKSEGARLYVVQKLGEKNIVCAFDHGKSAAVLDGQELPENVDGIIDQLVFEKRHYLNGERILKYFSIEEIRKILDERINWEEITLCVHPEERIQALTLIGTDESIGSAVALMRKLKEDFVDPFETTYPLEDRKVLSREKWGQLEITSRNLNSGCVKIYRVSGIQIIGKKETVEEFIQEMETILGSKADEVQTFPMTKKARSLLEAKSKAGVYLKEEAEKLHLDVSMDTVKDVYIIKKKTKDATIPKDFVRVWFDFRATSAKGLENLDEESIRSCLKNSDVDDEKVLIQIEENSVELIATADTFPDAKKVLNEMKKGKRYGEVNDQTSIKDQATDEEKKCEAKLTVCPTEPNIPAHGNDEDTCHTHVLDSTEIIFIDGISKDKVYESRSVNLSFFKATYLQQKRCEEIQQVMMERHNANISDISSNETGVTFTIERSNISPDQDSDWKQPICELLEKLESTISQEKISVCNMSPRKLTDDLKGKFETALLFPLIEESCIVVVSTEKSMKPIMDELLNRWHQYLPNQTSADSLDHDPPQGSLDSQGGTERTVIVGVVLSQRAHEAYVKHLQTWTDVTAKMEKVKHFDVLAKRKLVLLKGQKLNVDIFYGRMQSLMKEAKQDIKECKIIWDLKNVNPLKRPIMIHEEYLCFLQSSQTIQNKVLDLLLQKNTVCCLDEMGKMLQIWHVVHADLSVVEEIVSNSISHRILSLENYIKQNISSVKSYFAEEDEDIIQVHQRGNGTWICFPSDRADNIDHLLAQFEEEFSPVIETIDFDKSQYEVLSNFHQSEIKNFAKEINVALRFRNPANQNGKYQIAVNGSRRAVDEFLHFILIGMKQTSITSPLTGPMYEHLQTAEVGQKMDDIQRQNQCKFTFVEITDSPDTLQNQAKVVCRHFQKKKNFERNLMVVTGSTDESFSDVKVVPVWDTMKINPSPTYNEVLQGPFNAKFEKGSKVCFQNKVLIDDRQISVAYMLLPEKVETYEEEKVLEEALSQIFLKLKKHFPGARVLMEMNEVYEKLKERGLRVVSRCIADQFTAYDDTSLNLQLQFDYWPFARRAEVCLRSAFGPGCMNVGCDINMPKLVLGTLASAEVDVLVNTTSQDLNLENGSVSKSLLESAGRGIQRECYEQRSGPIQIGDIVKTSAGKIKDAKAIFHGALPQITENKSFCDIKKTLIGFMGQCLHQASRQGYSSIAFPALGTGKLAYPASEVAEAMFHCVATFRNQCPFSPLHDIQFVIYPSDKPCIQEFYAEETRRKYEIGNEGERIPEARFVLNQVLFQMVQCDVDRSNDDEVLYMVAHHKIEDFLESLQLQESDKMRVKEQLKSPCKTSRIHHHPLFSGPLVVCKYSRKDKSHDVWRRVFQQYTKKVTKVLLYEQTEEAELEKEFLKFLKDLKKNEVYLVIVFLSAMKFHSLASKYKAKYSEGASSTFYPRINEESKNKVFSMKTTGRSKESVTKSVEDVLKLVKEKFAAKHPKGVKQSATKDHDFEVISEQDVQEAQSPKGDQNDVCMVLSDTQYSPADLKKFLKGECKQLEIKLLIPHPLSSDEFIVVLPTQEIGHLMKKLGTLKTSILPSIMSAECKYKIPEEFRGCVSDVEFQESTGFNEGSLTSDSFVEGHYIQILATTKYLDSSEVFHDAPSESNQLPQTTTLSPPLTETSQPKEYKTEKLNPIQYAAAKHLVGEQELVKACRMKEGSNGQIIVTFFDTSTAKKIHGKVIGFNCTSIDIPTTKDVSLFLQNVMDDMKNVYAELDQEKKQVHIVSEEWMDLDAAKKRIQNKFTHNKPKSRANRTFGQVHDQSQTLEPSHSDSHQYSINSNPSIPDVVEGTPFFKIGFLTVKVYKTDMTKLKIDAIVNAANENLSHGSGVARAIADAAGSALEKEGTAYVHKHGPIQVSKVVATTSGNMKCKKVLHAVGPRWSDYSDKKKCLEDLRNTVLRCLIETSNHGLSAVAIPALSSGIFRVPKESCCESYVKGTKLFVENVHQKVSLQEVHFVDVSDKMVSMMTQAFEAFGQIPLTLEEKNLSFIEKELKAKPLSQNSTVTTMTKKSHQGGPAAAGLKTKQTLEGTRYSYKVGKHSTLVLYSEDLVKTKAEMLVSWEDLSQIPVNKASRALKNETGKIAAYSGGSKFLEVKSTDSGNLKSVNKIIHACCPSDSMTTEDLQTISDRIIDTGLVQGRSLAITVITSSKVDLTSFCEVLCKVLREKRDEIDQTFDVHLVDKDPAKVAEMKVILDKHFSPETSETVEGAVGGNLGENCVICHDVISDPKALSCSHKFCRPCIDQSFEYKPVCPSCGKIFGAVKGDMPPGTMTVNKMPYNLPGCSFASKTYMITYNIPSGRQTDIHPNPGEWYDGTTWYAYLPDTHEGETVLRLLKVAFDRCLTFTVGRSRTTGRENAVTWNDIHHKTTTITGKTFGYPDKGYFERVKGELAAKGVTEADIDWNKSLKSIFGL